MLNHRPQEQLSVWLADAFRALPFLLGLLAVSARPAHAYTDPGTGALVWQMLAAAFVGCMFYFRKFTSWFRRRSERPPSETEERPR